MSVVIGSDRKKNCAESRDTQPRARATQRQLKPVWARKPLYPQGPIEPPALLPLCAGRRISPAGGKIALVGRAGGWPLSTG